MKTKEIITPTGLRRYIVIDDQGEVVKPIVRFLKYLHNIGRARNTMRAYAYDLALYFEYLQRLRLEYGEVTLDNLTGFVLWLKTPDRPVDAVPTLPIEQARKNRSINRCLAAVSGLYEYLWRQSDTAVNLNEVTHKLRPSHSSFKRFLHHIAGTKMVNADLLQQPVAERRPKTLTKDQVMRLMNACNNSRDRLLIHLLYETGLRIGEALALWVEDLDIGARTIHVRDRGELVNNAEIKSPDSVRSLKISLDLMRHILEYLGSTYPCGAVTNHLFVKLHGRKRDEPLSYPEVNDLFWRLLRKTGVNARPHLLRHSCLSDLARKGLRPESLQRRAGHAHYQTTEQLYVHLSEEDMSNEWEALQLLDVAKPETEEPEDL